MHEAKILTKMQVCIAKLRQACLQHRRLEFFHTTLHQSPRGYTICDKSTGLEILTCDTLHQALYVTACLVPVYDDHGVCYASVFELHHILSPLIAAMRQGQRLMLPEDFTLTLTPPFDESELAFFATAQQHATPPALPVTVDQLKRYIQSHFYMVPENETHEGGWEIMSTDYRQKAYIRFLSHQPASNVLHTLRVLGLLLPEYAQDTLLAEIHAI